MAQFFRYPAGSTVTISAIGTNGATAPTTSIEVGGIGDDGNLHGVHTDNNGNVYTVDAFPATAKHVIVDSSALPTGASTSALQTTGNTSLGTIATNTTGVSTAAKQDTGNTSLSSIDTKATAGNASTASIDSKTPALGQALAAASVPVVLTAAQITTLTPLTSVTVTQATGTNLHTTVDNFPATQPVSGTVAATQSGTWNITNVSGTVSLPTGASTSALQTTGNTSLSSIDGKTPALGQALAAASVPVVLTAAQLTTLTPLTTIAATQSGTWTVQPGNTANTTAWLVNSVAKTPTAGTVTQAAITVGTTAVRLTVSGSAPNAARSVLMAIPDSASTASFYIGSSSVTNSGATRGVQIVAGQPFIANSDAGDYYIISSTAAQTVYVTEQA